MRRRKFNYKMSKNTFAKLSRIKHINDNVTIKKINEVSFTLSPKGLVSSSYTKAI